MKDLDPATPEGASAATGGGPGARRRALRGPHLRTVAFAALGAAIAAAYAYFVGCRTGTCLITSSVWTASVYGGAVGALVGWPARAR